MRKADSTVMIALLVVPLSVVGACAPAVAEPPQEPVAVDVPSAREVASTGAPERAPRGKGAFLSGMAFKSAKIRSAKVGADAMKMAAELQLATDGGGRCPSLKELIDGKKLDPNGMNDPWGNPYRIVCADDEVHAVSNGRDGIENTPDDIRDDASASDLKRIGDL